MKRISIPMAANDLTISLAQRFCHAKGVAKPTIQDLVASEAKNVKALWETFTIDRENLPRYLMNPKKQRSAYLMGFHLPNLMRSTLTWKRAENRYKTMKKIVESKQPIHILDIGSGTGAMTHGLILLLQSWGIDEARIQVTAIDQNKAFLETVTSGNQHLSKKIKTRTIATDIKNWNLQKTHLDKEHIHFIILGYVWNEISRVGHLKRKMERFLSQILTMQNAFIQISEPANQTFAREAMSLRENLAKHSKIIYPCPNRTDCPMLERQRDWCYSEFHWKPPSWINSLDKKLDLSRSMLAGAGYIFSTRPLQPNHSSAITVIVGKPLRSSNKKYKKKSEYELLLCSENGLSKQIPPEYSKSTLMRGQLLRNPSIVERKTGE